MTSAAHRKSIRFTLTLLILVPLLALTALWGYAASVWTAEGLALRDDAALAASAGKPAHTLVVRLQEERRLTAAWQTSPGDASRTAVTDARSSTDTAVARFRAWRAGADVTEETVKGRAAGLGKALEELSQQRDAIDQRAADGAEAFRYYTDTVEEGTALLASVTRIGDGRLAYGSAAVNHLVQFSEMLSREDALFTTAQASKRLTAGTRAEFGGYVAVQQQAATALDTADLSTSDAKAFRRITGSPQWTMLVSLEDDVVSGRTGLPKEAGKWRESADVVGKDLRELGTDALGGVTAEASSRADDLIIRVVIGSAVALAVLGAAGALVPRFTRSLVDRLTRIRQSAVELADNRLPRLVEQLGRGEQAEPVEPNPQQDHGADEVGRLAAATQYLAQAVETMFVQQARQFVQQARKRDGTEQAFLGLARRTQVLINRMIPKLDELERKHQDSDLLKDIFAVDHLATRVRRHTENLVILGGSPPVRRWSKAVPIYEVLRSAISETEHYSRVDALPAPQVSLVGRAVADVVHLLAELIENGTAFSPPETKVTVSAMQVAKGLALQVEDRGLGMTEENYEHINTLLAEPPELDMMTLGETPRLGIFVVARLAKRHNLEISLRKSPYGGTLAIVLLPSALLEETKSLLSGLISEHLQETQQEVQQELEQELKQQDAERAPEAPAVPGPRSGPDEPLAAAGAGAGMAGPGEGMHMPSIGTGISMPSSLDDHSGYPTYGGAGLLPITPGDPADDAAVPAARPHPHEGADHTAGHNTPTGDETPSGTPVTEPGEPVPPAPQASTAGRLPMRVRGESLAEPLRKTAHGNPEQDDTGSTSAPSPDRAGATMAAIQSANRRARTSRPADPPGGHDSQAGTPGHGAGPEDL
ncbi:nitrate- and nitrite sensing domain-containing protein [Streptomyces sp. NPDC051776]|uniref:sensor histidine kinase n=1 Tax=Streptomyces sp. NPDC051776 TaxID=3155414 RepID=UPI0034239FB9